MKATRLPLKLEFTGDRQVDQAQRNAHEVVRAANSAAAVAVRRTSATTFTAGGSAVIYHGLDLPSSATPTGWRVIDVSGGYGSFQRTAWDSRSITIQSQNACTAVFEVFA